MIGAVLVISAITCFLSACVAIAGAVYLDVANPPKPTPIAVAAVIAIYPAVIAYRISGAVFCISVVVRFLQFLEVIG